MVEKREKSSLAQAAQTALQNYFENPTDELLLVLHEQLKALYQVDEIKEKPINLAQTPQMALQNYFENPTDELLLVLHEQLKAFEQEKRTKSFSERHKDQDSVISR